jgi:large subunit ribosomal protein L19
MQNKFMAAVESASLKATVPHFEIGDTVDVHVRILEGDKERIQIYNGVVIARSGAGTREMFTVRRIVQGEGVERIFPLHSPRLADIVVKRSGKVRRAKLYYLRDRTGKAVRLKERFPARKTEESATKEAEKKAAKAEKKAAKAEKKAAKAARKQNPGTTAEG